MPPILFASLERAREITRGIINDIRSDNSIPPSAVPPRSITAVFTCINNEQVRQDGIFACRSAGVRDDLLVGSELRVKKKETYPQPYLTMQYLRHTNDAADKTALLSEACQEEAVVPKSCTFSPAQSLYLGKVMRLHRH